ncbi:MAG: ThiF family adenylyltransferase [Candidatus Omnitrophica bacterium]|nr:ThiF family adenylyltransferase [Candidatus Omnitrophota bacterium]
MQEFSGDERQFILREIGREGQRALDASRVAIVGMGILGSIASDMLARAGIGVLRVIDRDFLKAGDRTHQGLFRPEDLALRLPKATAAAKRLQEINPEICIEPVIADLGPENVDEVLKDIHLVIDGTDNFETRYLINDFSLSHKIPWIYGGALSTEGMSYVILPGKGPCLRCLFGEGPVFGDKQSCDQWGILAPVGHLIASFQVIEAIKILAGKFDAVERKLWKVDLWSRQFKAISVLHLESMPCEGCKRGKYPWLEKKEGLRLMAWRGRNAVQVSFSPENREKPNLEELISKWGHLREVSRNPYYVRGCGEDFEITVFQCGRTIIQGTEDPGKAKSLYEKYISAL